MYMRFLIPPMCDFQIVPTKEANIINVVLALINNILLVQRIFHR